MFQNNIAHMVNKFVSLDVPVIINILCEMLCHFFCVNLLEKMLNAIHLY